MLRGARWNSDPRNEWPCLQMRRPIILLKTTSLSWPCTGNRACIRIVIFSWRLVMMPEWVLDYVVAHEVAHLEVLNHSPRFWSTVEKLTSDVKGANEWLRRHGAEVHRYG